MKRKLLFAMFFLLILLVGCMAPQEAPSVHIKTEEKEIVIIGVQEQKDTLLWKQTLETATIYANEYKAAPPKILIYEDQNTIEKIMINELQDNSLVVLLGDELKDIAANCEKYTNLYFIWVNTEKDVGEKENLCQFGFDSNQIALLAGYMAVSENYYECGIAVCDIENDSSEGFFTGAAIAAENRIDSEKQVLVNTKIELSFNEKLRNKSFIEEFFQMNGNLLFLSTPLLAEEAISVAQRENGYLITLNAIYSDERILATIQTDVRPQLKEWILEWNQGTFPAKQRILFTLQEETIAIDWENAQLINFTQDDYNQVKQLVHENKPAG